MKLISHINADDRTKSTFTIELDDGEQLLAQHSVDFPYCDCYGELFIPEGIQKIGDYALSGTQFHTIHFPKSLKELGNPLFSANYYFPKVTIVYAGTSAEFQTVAAIKKEEVLESDGFDHYPYYSGGSRWVTYYRCFDDHTSNIEVVCTDGVTLLYGRKHRREDAAPKIKT